jgi:hypothetical protein
MASSSSTSVGPERRLLLPNTHVVTISVRSLNEELTCCICLCIIRRCTVISICLHRFCFQCITMSLIRRRECPQCRLMCPSKRHLRHDGAFDLIISAIYPDLDKAESEQEASLALLLISTEDSRSKELELGLERQRSRARESEEPGSQEQETGAIRLRPLPTEKIGSQVRLKKPFCQCNNSVTVGRLNAYICKRLSRAIPLDNTPSSSTFTSTLWLRRDDIDETLPNKRKRGRPSKVELASRYIRTSRENANALALDENSCGGIPGFVKLRETAKMSVVCSLMKYPTGTRTCRTFYYQAEKQQTH